MISQLSEEQGKFLVELARNAIATYLKTKKKVTVPEDTPEQLQHNAGVFVTLSDMKKGGMLRGCIGFPTAQMRLAEATILAAIEAATDDPRFDPISPKEFDDRIITEVSVMTSPALIQVSNTKEYLDQIQVGRDGLIVESGPFHGLLLPQVPVEYKWDEEEFICNCCMKAGLPPDAWLLDDTKVYKFQAIVFEEERPHGNVRLKRLTPEEQE